MEFPGSDLPNDNFRSHLSSRLLDARTIVVNDALSQEVAGTIAEQVTLLEAESHEPIQVMMSSAPGGVLDAGLSTYDLLRSVTAPVTILGSGRIAGAGVVAFLGPPKSRRFALPHTRFCLEEPSDSVDSGSADALDREAQEAARRYERTVALLADETGQPRETIEEDLASRRSFEADEAAAYGLIDRVVLSRSEID